MIAVLTLTDFLPSAGHPMLATAVSILCNAVNLVMDYVLLKFFHMGVEGTAWATLIGVLSGAVLLAVMILTGRMKLYVCRDIPQSLTVLKEVAKKGSPDAMTQVGYSLKFAVCNSMAMACAGTMGMVAFSLCMQAISFVSIFLGALNSAAAPILGVLHGERDYRGEAGVLKTVLILQGFVALFCTLFFAVFAPQFAAAYNITQPEQASMAIHALRVFSLSYVARNISVFYFRYLNVIGLEGYAVAVSALDGFSLIIPVVLLLCRLFGIEGLWWAFPVVSVLLPGIIACCNRWFLRRYPGKYRSLLLLEADSGAEPLLDVTITQDTTSISGISETLQDATGDNAENISILRGFADSIENEYVMGMNCTRLVLRGRSPERGV